MIGQNGQTNFDNLAAFETVFDYFGTLCIKGLKIQQRKVWGEMT